MRIPSSRLRVLFALALGAAVSAAVAAVAVIPGCSSHVIGDCPTVYDGNRIGSDGQPDPCCERTPPEKCKPADGGTDAPEEGPPGAGCGGTCVRQPPVGFWGPLLAAIVASGTSPSCPAGTASAGLEGYHVELTAEPITCGACSCAPSDGTCGAPPTITARQGQCADGATSWQMSSDPPPGWDGACTVANAIAAPSVESVLVAPLTIMGNCAPTTADAPPPPTPTWGGDVVACEALAAPSCGDAVHVCAPADPAFRTCVYAPGDTPCPESWPARLVIANDYLDERACTPCTCGPVEGGACTATLGVFTDGACTTPQLVVGVSSDAATCFDVTPAGPLGSKSLSAPHYTPGACAPAGGVPTDGGVTASGLATLCCLPYWHPLHH